MVKRYFRQNQMYGIELPKTTERALEIDRETGTTFWHDAIRKEMKTVGVAFKILEEDERVPPGHSLLNVHLIFSVKADFTRKVRLVAGSHLLKAPEVLTYAGVVSRESI